jgi:hypothetical protein
MALMLVEQVIIERYRSRRAAMFCLADCELLYIKLFHCFVLGVVVLGGFDIGKSGIRLWIEIWAVDWTMSWFDAYRVTKAADFEEEKGPEDNVARQRDERGGNDDM